MLPVNAYDSFGLVTERSLWIKISDGHVPGNTVFHRMWNFELCWADLQPCVCMCRRC